MPEYENILDLVRAFDSGEIQLPIMQRDYVWKQKQVIKLMDSLYNGWPIGAFYLWQSDKQQKLRTPIPNHPFDYLLDGQQRLTSISRAIAEGTDSLESKVFFDVLRDEDDKKKFVMGDQYKGVIKRLDRGDPTLVPLSALVPINSSVDTDGILEKIKESNDITEPDRISFSQKLQKASRMFDTKKATIERIKTEETEVAIEIFARLNSGGTTLKAGDIQAAQLAQERTVDLLPKMRKFMMSDKSRALGYDFAFIVRCLATLHRDSANLLLETKTKSNFFQDKNGRNIKQTWEATRKCLESVNDFVINEMGWTTRRWLPSTNALIPIAYLVQHNHGSKIINKDKDFIKQFLCLSALRKLFSGSVDTTINKYVNPIKNATKDNRGANLLIKKILKKEKYPITQEDVLQERRMVSSLMQVYLAYLVAQKAKSWIDGCYLADVDLEVHHIFPKQLFLDNDLPMAKANTMANYALISQHDNKALGDLRGDSPKGAYGELTRGQKKSAAIQSVMIGKNDLLELDSYDKFCERRANDIAEKLNQFVGIVKPKAE
ncbi:DUF262 domain-containing protein [Thermodesulfobacteriota bacterium]